MAFENRDDRGDEEKQEKELRKVQIVAKSYYARKDVQEAIFEFCKHRETVPNFNKEFFGKRPDMLDYPNDLFNYAKKGATSFHCSEELWGNPLDINTDMTPEQYNKIKIGWDFLIDIDSPFLDYGKIAARLLIGELERHGVINYGIKYSGSKGFHILVPFKAFPETIGEELTKDKFPEWPRLIAGYLFSLIRGPMNEEILKLTGRETLKQKGELVSESLCPRCGKPTIKKKTWKYKCPNIKCKSEMESFIKKRTAMLCPNCNAKMDLIEEREVSFCEGCKISTARIEASSSSFGGEIRKDETRFKVEDTIKSTQDSVDLILVAPRHLFRAPYSLHEKTALASVVLDKNQIEDFKPTDADPLKITPIPYMPNPIPGEAENLLLRALDWGKENAPKEREKKYEGKSVDLKGLTIEESMFPDVIKKILKGMKSDGRKRALGILLPFLTSLEFPQDYIEEKVYEWNKKNYNPLKTGYVQSQIIWALKNKRMPQNYDKPIYKDLGFPVDAQGVKNPINYTIKEAFRAKGKSQGKKRSPEKKGFEI